jgi:hypothetical protein
MSRKVKEGCPNCDGTARPSCPMCGGTNVPFPEESGPDFKKILREFVGDIEATGGVFQYEGTEICAPVGAKDWTDLGETYLKACKALRKRPHVVKEDA